MSSMYKFVKGSRLFMQGTRQNTDYDNVSDTFHPTFADNIPTRNSESKDYSSGQELDFLDGDDIRAVHTLRSMTVDGNTEWERSSKSVRKGGVRTRSTRTVRKVTTVTKGEQSVTSESVMHYGSDNAQRYPAVTHDKKSLKFRVVDKVKFVSLIMPNPSVFSKIQSFGIVQIPNNIQHLPMILRPEISTPKII